MHKARYTGCVYLATNTVNGRCYIGKTISGLATRRITHHYAANRGRCGPFHSALRKYGFSAFGWHPLFESDDERLLLDAEIALIADYRADGRRLYNLTTGGDGVSMPCSDKRKAQVAAAGRGRVKTPETRRKMSEANKGVKRSATTRERIRLCKLGTKMAPWTKERRAKCAATWAAKKAAGFHVSAETRAAMAAAAKRRAEHPDERQRLRDVGDKGRAARWTR